MREGSKTGHCSCTVRSGRWFNARLEIRGNRVNVIMSARAYWCTEESTIWLPNSGAGAICPCEVDGSLVSVGKLDVGNARDKGTFDGTDS